MLCKTRDKCQAVGRSDAIKRLAECMSSVYTANEFAVTVY